MWGHGLSGSDMFCWGTDDCSWLPTHGFRVVGQNAFIIRSGRFDAAQGLLRAQGLLSAYAFLYEESEGEEILSTICFC